MSCSGTPPALPALLPDLALVPARRSSSPCPGCSRRSTTVREQQASASPVRSRIFQAAARTAIAWSRPPAPEPRRRPGPVLPLRLQHAFFDRLVYAKLRAAVGGRVSTPSPAGCPAPGNGSATSSAARDHRPRGIRAHRDLRGGVGEPAGAHQDRHRRPAPARGQREDRRDGEILVWPGRPCSPATGTTRRPPRRCSSPTAGCTPATWATRRRRDPSSHRAQEGTDRDGRAARTSPPRCWRTGSAPTRWSARSVVGDRPALIACLITMDQESGRAGRPGSATTRGHLADSGPTRLLAELQAAVDERTRPFTGRGDPRVPGLARWLPEASGELTPSLKVRRNVIMKDYAGEIEALYP